MNIVQPAHNPRKKRLISKGFKALAARDFKCAGQYFALALLLDSSDKRARIGILIADIAYDFPKKAEIFAELYQILLASAPRARQASIHTQMLDILRDFDTSLDHISQAVETEDALESEQLNGIAYKDFMKLCDAKGFKEVFENLIFSTKIIFTERDDFYRFLKDLIHYGFKQIALSYIEEMPQTAYNSEIQEILKQC